MRYLLFTGKLGYKLFPGLMNGMLVLLGGYKIIYSLHTLLESRAHRLSPALFYDANLEREMQLMLFSF